MGGARPRAAPDRVDRRLSEAVHVEDRSVRAGAHRTGREQGERGPTEPAPFYSRLPTDPLRLASGVERPVASHTHAGLAVPATIGAPMIPAPSVDLGALLPSLIVFGAGVLVLLLDLLPPRSKEHLGGVALAGLVVALLSAIPLWNRDARAFRDMVLLDN